MTKWFDTNYHYVVPELTDPPTELTPLPWRVPVAGTTWVILGPFSLVKLSKVAGDQAEIAQSIGRSIWALAGAFSDVRLQLDEPCLGLELDDRDRALLEAAYRDLPEALRPLITIQFGSVDGSAASALADAGAIVQTDPSRHSEQPWQGRDQLLVAVMDGRSVWADGYESVADSLAGLPEGADVIVAPSTSLMFLPVTTEGEDLPDGFQFAREKAGALATWAKALEAGGHPATPTPSVPEFPPIGEVEPRVPREERRAAQADLDLPPFPTTTTGSLPQTSEVRRLRVSLRRGDIDQQQYDDEIDRLITDAVKWQEEAGLDVLVHGEFERTDMVEFFGERMDGFLTTSNGWVNSYGSRCVRPPILAAPPSISEPMTVREWQVAQAATDKPVKGMLTGPVTIVNWSFRPPGVSDDRLFWAVAQPIAQEVAYLEEAGARVVQIDEPAVRERWPLPTADAGQLREIYARGVRAALARVFAGPPRVQLHTHMCYGDFADIVPLWGDAGVDVASIEFSRSKDERYIRLFYDLFEDGNLAIGPGVFDVHSPHSPGEALMEERLRHFLGFMDPADLWVNPDCGLKTRTWDEVRRQVDEMVGAARALREG
jgi:5-methyltetrahydropteroyltriglutamate--homocysteine methyltransferase